MEHYRHIQSGHLVLVAVGLGLLAIVIVGSGTLLAEFDWGAFAAIVGSGMVLAVSLLLFTTLTVAIREEALEVRFGPVGLVKKRFLLRDVESCQAVRNRWWYSWGIHLTPHGWLFNVSGLDAVELTMRNGKTYRIGTDEPEALEQAISQFTS